MRLYRMFITQKELLKLAIYANVIYVALLFLFRPDGFNIENIVITSFLLTSVVIILFLCYINRKNLLSIPKTTRIIFYLLLFWSVIVVVRSFSLNLQDWLTNFGNVYMAFSWFVPVLIILGQKVENWNVIVGAIFFMFMVMIFAYAFFPVEGKSPTEWTWLLRPINFIFLLGVYRFKLTNRIIIIIALTIYILLAINLKQRIEFLFLFLVLFFLIIERLKHIKIKRVFLKYIIFSFVILLILVFTYGYENINRMANNIVEFQDSRTFLFNELFDDLSNAETIFGKGSLGTYFSPFMEHTKNYITNYLNLEWWGDASDRITIEVGYLQMILKGGFVLFLLTVTLMINSAYLAIFKSNSKFIKRLGLFILIMTILSLISFRPAFTPTFIILWFAIGTVLNKNNRKMTDEDIQKRFLFR
ncbi:hypothetical protein RXV94_00655 [Yeosuana sp. MJ-SS3]|uniref:O-antigen ligase family protein n=1 Tax=Gilvirhabdus luticola TaxID=3079858 RepID=A0ABU3U2L5_9FLAO|nr:hypothetical protein [Yeosuana sp. MJ-SS3]MDU8884649.1 hypothetical protein [Yeosuana sp. MJ-SS3]